MDWQFCLNRLLKNGCSAVGHSGYFERVGGEYGPLFCLRYAERSLPDERIITLLDFASSQHTVCVCRALPVVPYQLSPIIRHRNFRGIPFVKGSCRCCTDAPFGRRVLLRFLVDRNRRRAALATTAARSYKSSANIWRRPPRAPIRARTLIGILVLSWI